MIALRETLEAEASWVIWLLNWFQAADSGTGIENACWDVQLGGIVKEFVTKDIFLHDFSKAKKNKFLKPT